MDQYQAYRRWLRFATRYGLSYRAKRGSEFLDVLDKSTYEHYDCDARCALLTLLSEKGKQTRVGPEFDFQSIYKLWFEAPLERGK